MRASTSAVFFSGAPLADSMDAGRRISGLTHWDPDAREGTALMHALVKIAIAGGDPLAELPRLLPALPSESQWEPYLSVNYRPDDLPNGDVWRTLGGAVWALRKTSNYSDAVILVIDELGWDTDTTAAVTGTLAGAIYGVDAIPAHWREQVRSVVPGMPSRGVWPQTQMADLAVRLLDAGPKA